MSGRWTGRRVLVTGATGVVGAWLVKALLAAGAQVVAFVRDADPQSEMFRSGDARKVTAVNGSVEDFWAVERAVNEHQVEVVFHLAAQTIVGTALRFPLPTFETNVRGTYHVFEACRLHSDLVRGVILASSDKVYGEQPALPYTEEMALAGRQPYEVSKACADLIAQSYHATYGLPVAIARCGNIFGGGDLNWSRIVPGTIRALLHGERPVLRSDGRYVRDYLYVKDAARALLLLAENLDQPGVQGEAFNFSPESRVTVLEIVDLIRRLLDRPDLEPIILGTARGEIVAQSLSAEKARQRLKWAPQWGLEDGLQETIDWYREYFGSRPDLRG